MPSTTHFLDLPIDVWDFILPCMRFLDYVHLRAVWKDCPRGPYDYVRRYLSYVVDDRGVDAALFYIGKHIAEDTKPEDADGQVTIDMLAEACVARALRVVERLPYTETWVLSSRSRVLDMVCAHMTLGVRNPYQGNQASISAVSRSVIRKHRGATTSRVAIGLLANTPALVSSIWAEQGWEIPTLIRAPDIETLGAWLRICEYCDNRFNGPRTQPCAVDGLVYHQFGGDPSDQDNHTAYASVILRHIVPSGLCSFVPWLAHEYCQACGVDVYAEVMRLAELAGVVNQIPCREWVYYHAEVGMDLMMCPYMLHADNALWHMFDTWNPYCHLYDWHSIGNLPQCWRAMYHVTLVANPAPHQYLYRSLLRMLASIFDALQEGNPPEPWASFLVRRDVRIPVTAYTIAEFARPYVRDTPFAAHFREQRATDIEAYKASLRDAKRVHIE